MSTTFLLDVTFASGVGSQSIAAAQLTGANKTAVEIPSFGGEGPSGDPKMAPQAGRLFVTTDNAAGTATLQVAFQYLDSNTVKTYFRSAFTCTVGALRDAEDGASGYYHMTVVDPITGRDTFDFMGLEPGCKCYLLLTASSNIVRVKVATTRNAG